MSNSSVDAWVRFCDQAKATGCRLLEDGYPNQSERDQAEGVRHVSRVMTLAINQFVEANNPDFPRFLRQNDDITQWGGNNLDNGYYISHIDEQSEYRVYGNVRSVPGFILSVRDGYMHENKLVCKDLSSKEMSIGDDGSFEVIVSRERRPGNWLEMIPGATQLGVRVYYYDWQKDTPPELQIVKVGNEGRSPAPLTADKLVRDLDAAGRWLDVNIVYWNDWMKNRASSLPVNSISAPHRIPGGSNETITYSGGRYELAEDEALVVIFEPIVAEYLGIMIYTDAWFETVDMHNRLGGFNNRQLAVDGDGRIRVVLAARDPGVNNWIDTEGRSRGLMTLRTINGDSPPVTAARLVKSAALDSVLPDDTTRLDEVQRRQQIQARREHMVSRFHR